MPCPDVPAIDEERWIEGNGGVIRFYSQGPVEAVRFPLEGLAAESLVENWWLRRYDDRGQMSYKLDLVCDRMDFHGIPIDYCAFDLAGSGIGRRISGEGTYIGQHIDHHKDRIVQIDARSLTIRENSPDSSELPAIVEFAGNLYVHGGEAGHTVCQMLPSENGAGLEYGVYGIGPECKKPKVNEKAKELLLSFLDSKQQQDYRKLGYFGHFEEAAKREWRFYFRYHYPVEFRNQGANSIGLCIELENETPTEDILLMSLLEVRGGHGDDIIKAGKRNPEPLRDDQRLHEGASPDSAQEFRRLGEAFGRATISAERFRERIREQALRVLGVPSEQMEEENRETITKTRMRRRNEI